MPKGMYGLRKYLPEVCFIPYGTVIAIADLVDCVKVIANIRIDDKEELIILDNGMKIEGNEIGIGDFSYGRYAWILDNVRKIDPVPARGQQRIWNWDGEA